MMKTPLAGILCVALAGMAWADDKPAKSSGTLLAQVVPPVENYDRDRLDRTDRADQELGDREGIQTGRPMKLNKVSNLIGIEVKNLEGDDLGDVKDIVIDLEKGSVSYVVISSGGVLGIGEKLLAVPLTAFSRSADQDHLVLQADKDSISKAEGIKDNDWPALQNPSFGAIPFWQERQETDVPRTTEPLGERR
jgi:sporulation protein YlmC with PRC-barrel domain